MLLLEKLPQRVLRLGTLLLVGLVGLLDYVSGPDITFSVFYLPSILAATWFDGRRFGVLVAGLSAALAGGAQALSAPIYLNSIAPYWNAAVVLALFLLITYILSALKGALVQERDLARTDTLTGAANSRAFFEQVDLEIGRARRYRRTFTVAYLDIDNFKQVNDRFGHSAGDDLLRVVAETLQAKVRTTDVVARLGGDEFAILFVETGYQAAELAIERVRRALGETIRERAWPIGFSIGAVTCSGSVAGVDAILKRADQLMYGIKKSTKNAVRHERYHAAEQVA